jgi:hypothetical protein
MDFPDQVQTTLATEGLKFLLTQASDLIKWWRERRSTKDRVLAEGVQVGPQVTEELVEAIDQHHRVLTDALARPDSMSVEQGRELLSRMQDLQALLRRAIIVDEPSAVRPATEKQARLRAVLDLDLVQGRVAGVSARRAQGDLDIAVKVKTGDIGPTGQVHGIDIEEIGG